MKLKEMLPKGIYSIKPKKDNDGYYDNIMDYILDNTDIEDLVSIWESIENNPVFKNIPKFYKNECLSWSGHCTKRDGKLDVSMIPNLSKGDGGWYE
jgi:hypothetical protein